MKNIYLFCLAFFLAASPSILGNMCWSPVDEERIELMGPREIVPAHYFAFQLDLDVLLQHLASAKNEFSADAFQGYSAIELPLPDGSSACFHMAHSPVMSVKLSEKFPAINSW